MIKQIRIERGFTSLAALGSIIGIPYPRLYSIARMHIKATREEFELICGEIVQNYDDYALEFEAKKTLMFTARMENFAAYCGNPTPCETVRRYFSENRF